MCSCWSLWKVGSSRERLLVADQKKNAREMVQGKVVRGDWEVKMDV